MKNYLVLLICLTCLSILNSQSSKVDIIVDNKDNMREHLLDILIADIDDSFFKFRNNTALNDSFEPTLHGSTATNNRSGLGLMGNVQQVNDFGDTPIILMTSFVDNGNGVENGGYSFSSNRHYFRIRSFDSNLMETKYLFEIDQRGYIGLGTDKPKSKLHLEDGDVYIKDAARGVIMTSPNGSCWRMTVKDDGSPDFSSVTCPNN